MAVRTWTGAASGSLATAGNWKEGSVPVDGDIAYFPVGGADVTAGLDQSAIQLAQLIVEPGCATKFGTSSGYMQYDVADNTGRFEFHGIGLAYIDVGDSICSPQIFNSFTNGTGLRGLYLKGTAIGTLSIFAGQVALAGLSGEASTATTIRVLGPQANVLIGDGVTLTTLHVNDGFCELRAAATTLNLYDGEVLTRMVGAITTVNTYAGNAFLESTGTITALNINGGIVNMLESGNARTVTTPTLNAGEFLYDPAIVTLTNKIAVPSAGKLRITGERLVA